MNKFVNLTCITLTAGLFSVTALAGKDGNGNGAPSGAHYNLNIIGVENPKNSDMTGSNRHTIFVPLTSRKTAKIEQECNLYFFVH